MSGTVQRADGVSIVDQLSLSPTRSVTEDVAYTVVIAASGNHSVAFGPVSPASFVVIYATAQISATFTNLAGTSQVIKADHFILSNADITGISLTNPSGAAAVTVRIILGGA
jgi:hypothetical protein